MLGYGLRGLNAAQGLSGLLDANDKFQQGDYAGSAQDFVLAALSFFDVFGACFGAGTPILTPKGWQAIEEFQPGDLVLSRDETDAEAAVEPRMVEEVFVRMAEIWELKVGGQSIRTTAEHPFWVDGQGWTAAARLLEGDRLATREGRWAVVGGIWGSGEWATVYNMRVAEYHTYFVGRGDGELCVWSHNTKCNTKGADAPKAGPPVKMDGNSRWHDAKGRFTSAPNSGSQTIFKAPQPGKGQKLLNEGFHPDDFPSDGPYADGKAYFAKERALAEQYSGYGEGILEVEIPNSVYDARIKPYERPYISDPRYTEIPIPPSEFDVLNNALRRLNDE